MPIRRNYCCVPGCPTTVSDNITLHKFPNPQTYPKRLEQWKQIIGEPVINLDYPALRKNGRVCRKHFIPGHLYPKNRLCMIAVPQLGVPSPASQLSERENGINNPKESSKAGVVESLILSDNPVPCEPNSRTASPIPEPSEDVIEEIASFQEPRIENEESIHLCNYYTTRRKALQAALPKRQRFRRNIHKTNKTLTRSLIAVNGRLKPLRSFGPSSASGRAGSTHKENMRLKKALHQLAEENNMLRLKFEILLDVVADKTVETELQDSKVLSIKNKRKLKH